MKSAGYFRMVDGRHARLLGTLEAKEVLGMSSMADKIAKFARSQQGQRLVHKVQQYVARPENQRRLAQLRQRLAGQRKPNRHD
jgi:hypothetical protein